MANEIKCLQTGLTYDTFADAFAAVVGASEDITLAVMNGTTFTGGVLAVLDFVSMAGFAHTLTVAGYEYSGGVWGNELDEDDEAKAIRIANSMV